MSNGKSQSNADKQRREQESRRPQEEERKAAKNDHEQQRLDEGIQESFPASDPLAVSHID